MRERGSNTARPTKKGGGGLPIGARPVDFGASFRVDSVGFVAICRLPLGVSRRFGRFRRDLQTSSWRFVPIRSRFRRDLQTSSWRFVPTPCRHHADTMPTPCRHPADTMPTPCRHRRRDTKKPDSSIGESGFSYRKVSRALNLRLVPLASKRASARSVLSGLARRSCIVMLTSGRRHIVHYT